MYVKHKLKMDLTGPAVMPRVDMMQRDQYVRQIELELYCGTEVWEIPKDIHSIICYQKADGTGGTYDTVPDGKRAWTVSGNILTVDIAPQVLTCAGPVRMAVDILRGDAKVSTFTMMLYVQEAIPLGLESGDYFQLEGFLPIPEAGEEGQLLRITGVDAYGKVTGVEGYPLETAVDEALAQAKDSGDFDGLSAYEVAVKNGYEGTESEWLESLKGKGISAQLGDVQQINITGKLTSDSSITIDFDGSRIQGVKTPVEDTDAANKAYVDEAVANVQAALEVPDYWQSAVDTVVGTVKTLQNVAGREAVSFAWFSDSHVGADTAVYSGILAGEIMDRCHMPFAVFSGDAAMENVVKEDDLYASLAAAEEAFAPIGSDRLLQARGSCDGAIGANYQYNLNTGEIYDVLFRRQEMDTRRIVGGDGTYFYIDFQPAKVRFVILNSCWLQEGTSRYGFGNEQLNWLVSEVLQFDEEGWALVFACHVPPNLDAVFDGQVLLMLLLAFENNVSYSYESGTEGESDYLSVSGNFRDAVTGEVVGFFCGNAHKDGLTQTSQGFQIVTITSDADLSADESEEVRVAGTANEHAIDIVTINRNNGRVSLTRLGAGESRHFYF